MDNIAELHQRKIKLLDNNNLSNSVNKMIKVKHLPAELDAVTTIAGRYGKTEIVLRLLISQSNIDRVAKTYIYLTEDMFDLDSFKYIDKELGLGNRKISTDDLIKLRALRVVFNVIKDINTTSGPSGIVYVRTRQDGLCNYS